MICVKGKARQKGTPEQTCSVACLLQENGDLNLKQTNTGFHPRDKNKTNKQTKQSNNQTKQSIKQTKQNKTKQTNKTIK